MEWHYTKQGDQFGPVDYAELVRLAREGQITPDEFVWNTSMGDEWVPASSVRDLFASPSTPMVTRAQSRAASYSAGGTHNRDLMRMARESLHTRWGFAIAVTLLCNVIIAAASSVPFASLIIGGPMSVGLCLVFLSFARRTEADIGQLFQGFNCFGTALAAYLLMSLFIFLWLLLLIIPGIIAAYAYGMTFFIIADDPSVGALDAIGRSKDMMHGNKLKMFCLSWRFFGWALLCILTLGIGFLWLIPYIQTSIAHFYDDVKQQRSTVGMQPSSADGQP